MKSTGVKDEEARADTEIPWGIGIAWPEPPSMHLHRISIQTPCDLRIIEQQDQKIVSASKDPGESSTIGELIGGASPRAMLAGDELETAASATSPRAGAARGLFEGDVQQRILAALSDLKFSSDRLESQNTEITKRLSALETAVDKTYVCR